MVREGRVFISSGSKPDFGSSYLVQVLEIGAQVVSASSGTTVTVRAGHGFAAGDKYMNGTDTSTYSGTLTISSTDPTHLYLSSSYTVAAGDMIVNLGPDTGTTSPNYDGNGLTIYTDMDFSTSATNATVTADSNGRYRYWYDGIDTWELVRSGTSLIALYVHGATRTETTISSSKSQKIQNLTKSPYSSVAIYAAKGGDYKLLQQMTANGYWQTLLHSQTVNGTTCHAMNLVHLAKAFLSVHEADGSVVHTGTWSSGSNAAAYNTDYKYSSVTNDDVTWTTPASSTGVGLRVVAASNGGLAKVLIDGDATVATNIFTAQTLVTNGVYPNTILTANGGTLEPTDRVLDFANPLSDTSVFNVTTDYDMFVLLVDGLSAGVHTVQLVVTGYKRSSSTDYRVYSSGYMYRLTDTLLTDASTVPMGTTGLWYTSNSTSAQEYAIHCVPTGGGTATWLGNLAHGYDNQTSLTIYMDGVAISPTAGTTTVGTELEIERVSELFHPDYASGATKVCDVITRYRLNQSGLAVTTKKTWLIDMTIDTNYAAMFTLDRGVFSMGSIGSDTTDYTFTGSSTEFGTGEASTDIAYVWEPAGNFLGCLWLPDVGVSCNDFINTNALKVHIQDNAVVICKIYFRRNGEGFDETTSNGTIHRTHAVYRMTYLANTDEWLEQ